MMELPAYRWPSARSVLIGLYERAMIFLRRVGGIILAVSIVLWFLSSYPGAPAGVTEGAIRYSFAGQIGRALEVVLAPIGFNWQIAIALVPGMAAREVALGGGRSVERAIPFVEPARLDYDVEYLFFFAVGWLVAREERSAAFPASDVSCMSEIQNPIHSAKHRHFYALFLILSARILRAASMLCHIRRMH